MRREPVPRRRGDRRRHRRELRASAAATAGHPARSHHITDAAGGRGAAHRRRRRPTDRRRTAATCLIDGAGRVRQRRAGAARLQRPRTARRRPLLRLPTRPDRRGRVRRHPSRRAGPPAHRLRRGHRRRPPSWPTAGGALAAVERARHWHRARHGVEALPGVGGGRAPRPSACTRIPKRWRRTRTPSNCGRRSRTPRRWPGSTRSNCCAAPPRQPTAPD